MRITTKAALLLTLGATPLTAQDSADDAYVDAAARELVATARAARGQQGLQLRSYTAVVLERSASRLRLPLRDRLLGRKESAMRVRWSRDGQTVVQRLAGREEHMGGAVEPGSGVSLSSIFDPDADRIYFGIDVFDGDGSGSDVSRGSVSIGSEGVRADVELADQANNFWVAHPLAEGSERHYRYRSGDTLTLRLPDGRRVRSVELIAIPRRASFHHLRASLWIEPESGALVQALYRPARELDIQRDTVFIDAETVDELDVIPGMFRPIAVDLELMSVEYGLWEQRHWLPRRMSYEGYVRMGMVRIPFGGEIAYRIEEVEDEPGAMPLTPEQLVASWDGSEAMVVDTVLEGGDTFVVFEPADSTHLLESDLLPPPVWQDAPAFATNDELEALAERLEVLIPVTSLAGPPTFELQWLLGGRGLVRYNRVESLSLGVRGVVDHVLGRAHATLRLGAADLDPNVELGTLLPRSSIAWRFEAYRHLTTVDPVLPRFEAPPAALGLGNSAAALLFGRDDGQYYRASGALLALEPRPERRQWYRLSLFAERHEAARRKVEWNLAAWLDGEREFDANLLADEVDVAGASLMLAPWWGVGSGLQGGIELFGEGATGDSTFARASLIGRAILPLPASLRLGVEAAAGTSAGGLPVQYGWFLGGPATLRGYAGGVLRGEGMARGRVELARDGAAGFALFSDAGWAGSWDAFDAMDARASIGLGFTLMDGVVRLDVARAIRAPTGWRVHLYLDSLL